MRLCLDSPARVARLKGNGASGNAGRKVVVKVQYPNAEELFKSDILSLAQLARLMQYFNDDDESADDAEARKADASAGLEAALAEFKKQFLAEFDYIREVDDMQQIGGVLRKHPKFCKAVCVPEPIAGHCTRRVITMTYLPGPTLETRASALLKSAGVNLREGVKSVIKDEGSRSTAAVDTAESKAKSESGGAGVNISFGDNGSPNSELQA